MMRVCHKNTCPVGIATQDPRLREKFSGGADSVVHFMKFVAEEMRQTMAKLGFRSINEMVGRVDKLELRPAIDHWNAKGLDYSKILFRPEVGSEVTPFAKWNRIISSINLLIVEAYLKLRNQLSPINSQCLLIFPSSIQTELLANNRCRISRHHGMNGLPEDTLRINLMGSAGQSLGAFCPQGMTSPWMVTPMTIVEKVCWAKIIVAPSTHFYRSRKYHHRKCVFMEPHLERPTLPVWPVSVLRS